MLQIRLSKGSSLDGGLVRSAPSMETVTVACPEHLVIADLPVAKSVGVITTSAASGGRNLGRRSRRQLGDRIHFCVRCDFPIAIYGRLIPCEHSFCLACARSDPSCYLCEERVQKIQTVKMLEGIFVCAAPHCLKSFLKKAEFESHVHETHADLLQSNAEKEGGGEINNFNVTRPSSADPQKNQTSLPETSTARAPSRPGFSPSSNSQPQDREDRNHRPPSRDQPHFRPLPQVRPPHFPSSQLQQPGDVPTESNAPRGSDRPYNWFNHQQDADRAPPESTFPNFAPQPNYSIPVNLNQPLTAASFNFHAFPADGSQPFFSSPPFEMPPRQESMPPEGVSEQGSVLGLPPIPGFRENYPRPWGMDPSMGFPNLIDSQGGMTFFQGDFSQNLMLNPLPGKESELLVGPGNHGDGKGMATSLPGKMPLPPPPPAIPPPSLQQINRGRFPGSGDASREVRFGNWAE